MAVCFFVDIQDDALLMRLSEELTATIHVAMIALTSYVCISASIRHGLQCKMTMLIHILYPCSLGNSGSSSWEVPTVFVDINWMMLD